MGDKVRGKLNQIDWSKSNQVAININRQKHRQEAGSRDRPAPNQISRDNRSRTGVTSSQNDDSDIPINRYRSVVAPVKSGREEERVITQRASAEVTKRKGTRHSAKGSDSGEDGNPVYVGYIGSLNIPHDSMSTGIWAIQRPMCELYFPYREQQTYAQERIITQSMTGLNIYYLPSEHADEPESLTIEWDDILYVEPLRFSTKKHPGDKKAVLAAFEPCEAQRLALLGNRDSLFVALSKQHKHISLLKHPALLCMVVRSPHSPTELFAHGYICGTVEDSVFLARNIRDELDTRYRESLKSGGVSAASRLSASHLSLSNEDYKLNKHSSSKVKVKHKKKEKRRDSYTTHTGDDEDDLGTYHFGMMHSPSPSYNSAYGDVDDTVNDNFVFGQAGKLPASRRDSRNSSSSDGRSQVHPGYSNGRPVGVVQPQAPAVRDGFKVLPSNVQLDRSNLKPTAVNVKTNRYSDVTPELDQKLKMRQQEEEPMLSPMAPRSVVNPLAEAEPEQQRKSFLSPTPGPINKMSTSLPFKPAAAMPQSGWHEPVLGNFKSKEKIHNKLNSQMVDATELPKMKSDKKEQEIAHLFSDLNVDSAELHEENNNFSLRSSGPTSQLHEAMGFMP
ncbi:uncharacterized protein [Watersipora subatra]|uniref:uncharacterized protein n=1 Tax=Watersipora subatra TaxID=2589382 RepID=UPI00355C3CB4